MPFDEYVCITLVDSLERDVSLAIVVSEQVNKSVKSGKQLVIEKGSLSTALLVSFTLERKHLSDKFFHHTSPKQQIL